MVSLEHRTARFDREGHDRRDVDGLFLKPDLTAGYSRNLEQVVDQLSHLSHLVVDDVAGPAQVGVVRTALLHDLDGIADRGQRIAQLVTQHGQKLVLASIGFGELPRRRLAVEKGGLGPLPLGDFPLITFDIAGDRPPREQRHQSERRGPTCDRRQQRHERQMIDGQHDQQHSQAAKLPQKSKEPPNVHTRSSRRNRARPVPRQIRPGRSPRRSTNNRVRARHPRRAAQSTKPGRPACQSRADPEARQVKDRDLSVQDCRLPRRGLSDGVGSSCRRPCRDASQMCKTPIYIPRTAVSSRDRRSIWLIDPDRSDVQSHR